MTFSRKQLQVEKKVAARDQKSTIIDGNQSQYMRAMHYGL